MKKKVFTVIIALVMTAALFAAGGQSGGQTSQGSGADIVTPPGTFPVVSTPITLRVFAGGSASIENFETNEFTRFYEQKTGVKLDWQIAPPNTVAEQRRLSLASGDLPDFYMGAGFTRADEVLYGSEKVLVPLNTLIDKHGFWIHEMFNDLPDARSLITTPDGNIYCLPNGQEVVHTMHPHKLFLNMEWMKNLNLQIPATTEDFFNVMQAFKTGDPNGNGRADEIPHITDQPGGGGTNNLFYYFVNSFIQMDGDGYFVTNANRVDIAYNKPEFRQALAYLNRLLVNGLLDPT